MTCSIHQRKLVLQQARVAANSEHQAERGKHTQSSSKESIVPTAFVNADHYPSTANEAREHVSMFLQHSRRMGNNIHEIPTFDSRELLLGRWLGKGGFSDVDELRGLLHIPDSSRQERGENSMRQLFSKQSRSQNDMVSTAVQDAGPAKETPGPVELGYESMESSESTSSEDTSDNDPSSFRRSCSSSAPPPGNEAGRKFLINNCLRDSGEARYAIKRLRKEIVQDAQQYPSGAMDLAVEALFLADLSHPNIIKLRAIAASDPFSIPNDDYYFLVLDRLQDTLTVRMKKWRERKRKLKTLVGRIADVGGCKRQALLDERLAAAFDLSAAMAYLKQNRILHRDIKPENLGFDIVSTCMKSVWE